MGNQKLKEQAESKNSLITDVDNIIKILCQRIKNETVPIGQEAETIKALAELVTARAMLS